MSELAACLAEIAACRICRDTPLYKPSLPHEPRPVLRLVGTPPVIICGQAPGVRVHASGLPFTDRSGDRLRDWLGIDADTFYDTKKIGIVPMGFCFPGQNAKGGDLPPRRECALTWHDRLFAALPAPVLLICLGMPALAYHMRRLGLEAMRAATLSQTLENWRAIAEARQAPRLIALPHPSWRNNAWIAARPWFTRKTLPYLRAATRKALSDNP